MFRLRNVHCIALIIAFVELSIVTVALVVLMLIDTCVAGSNLVCDTVLRSVLILIMMVHACISLCYSILIAYSHNCPCVFYTVVLQYR